MVDFHNVVAFERVVDHAQVRRFWRGIRRQKVFSELENN